MTTVHAPAARPTATDLSVWPASTTEHAPGDLAVGGRCGAVFRQTVSTRTECPARS
ncbi:hypothetical protein [Streptomyces sp. CA-251251]|uniref:hypothetical protein n=1 Tax=Streptomyces sp. CA-251251 TaxID=3240063 RepID=UPI003D94FBE0